MMEACAPGEPVHLRAVIVSACLKTAFEDNGEIDQRTVSGDLGEQVILTRTHGLCHLVLQSL